MCGLIVLVLNSNEMLDEAAIDPSLKNFRHRARCCPAVLTNK
jgi:hypothetical protein